MTTDQKIVLKWVGKADWYHVIAQAISINGSYSNFFDTIVVDYKCLISLNNVGIHTKKIEMCVIGVNGPVPNHNSTGNAGGDFEGFVYAFWSQISGGYTNSVIIKNRIYLRNKMEEVPSAIDILKQRLQRYHNGKPF